MIQVEEYTGLGAGQQIETEMAKQVGLKIFRTYTELPMLEGDLMGSRVSSRVKAWYDSGCMNMGLENITFTNYARGTRPESEPDKNKW